MPTYWSGDTVVGSSGGEDTSGNPINPTGVVKGVDYGAGVTPGTQGSSKEHIKFGYNALTGIRVGDELNSAYQKFGYDVRTGIPTEVAQRREDQIKRTQQNAMLERRAQQTTDRYAQYRDKEGNVSVIQTGMRPGFESNNPFGDYLSQEGDYDYLRPSVMNPRPKQTAKLDPKYGVVLSSERYEAQRPKNLIEKAGAKLEEGDTKIAQKLNLEERIRPVLNAYEKTRGFERKVPIINIPENNLGRVLLDIGEGTLEGISKKPVTTAANAAIALFVTKGLGAVPKVVGITEGVGAGKVTKHVSVVNVAGGALAVGYGADAVNRVIGNERPRQKIGEIIGTEVVPMAIGGYVGTKPLPKISTKPISEFMGSASRINKFLGSFNNKMTKPKAEIILTKPEKPELLWTDKPMEGNLDGPDVLMNREIIQGAGEREALKFGGRVGDTSIAARNRVSAVKSASRTEQPRKKPYIIEVQTELFAKYGRPGYAPSPRTNRLLNKFSEDVGVSITSGNFEYATSATQRALRNYNDALGIYQKELVPSQKMSRKITLSDRTIKVKKGVGGVEYKINKKQKYTKIRKGGITASGVSDSGTGQLLMIPSRYESPIVKQAVSSKLSRKEAMAILKEKYGDKTQTKQSDYQINKFLNAPPDDKIPFNRRIAKIVMGKKYGGKQKQLIMPVGVHGTPQAQSVANNQIKKLLSPQVIKISPFAEQTQSHRQGQGQGTSQSQGQRQGVGVGQGITQGQGQSQSRGQGAGRGLLKVKNPPILASQRMIDKFITPIRKKKRKSKAWRVKNPIPTSEEMIRRFL